MAIVTKSLGSIADVDGALATLSVDYDDARLRLTAVRVANATARPARAVATAVADPTRTSTLDAPAGQTSTQSLPTGTQQRLDITVDARGRVDGVDYTFYLL